MHLRLVEADIQIHLEQIWMKFSYFRYVYSLIFLCRFMAWQSEMAATLQQHHNGGVLVSSAASPTPSLDSLTGTVLANGSNPGASSASDLTACHEHSESSSGLATSVNTNNTDRVSSSSASSSGLGSSPLGNGSLFSSNATKCAICSGTFQRPKVNIFRHSLSREQSTGLPKCPKMFDEFWGNLIQWKEKLERLCSMHRTCAKRDTTKSCYCCCLLIRLSGSLCSFRVRKT